MKKIALVCFLTFTAILFFVPCNSFSQDWETLWVKYVSPPSYNWMLGSVAFTGIAYDKVRNQVYVVSAKTLNGMNDTHVYIFDSATGDTTGQLIIDKNIINNGFSLGRFCLFKIQVSDDGKIYACNLVAPLWGICYPGPMPPCDPLYLNQGPYKIFKWDTPTSWPKLVYKTPAGASDTAYFGGGMTYTRWGDAFSVIGTGDSTIIHASGGDPGSMAMNSEFDRFQARDITTDVFDLKRKMQSSLNGVASHGLAPTGTAITKPMWVDCNVRVASLQSQDNPPISISDIPVSFTHTSGTIRYFELPAYDRRFVIVCDGQNTSPGDSTKARIIDVSDKSNYFNVLDPTPPIDTRPLNGSSGNKNWVNDVDFRWDGLKITLFVLMSNNGIGAFRNKTDFPVELASLTANIVDKQVMLNWFITQETNNFGFDVQRSLDGGSNWEKIGFVSGRGTTNIVKEYSFSDPLKNVHITVPEIQYRLRQIDLDGRYNYSPTVKVLYNSTPSVVELSQNYPNPFNPTTNITYQLAQAGFVSLKVYNAFGQEVKTVIGEEQKAGAHTMVLDATSIPSGVYYYRLNALGKTLQKKMVVMK